MYRENEQYDSVLCSLMWFKYIQRKSSGYLMNVEIYVG